MVWHTDKPGSVVDEHSSGHIVTDTLKQPTRVQRGQRHMDTYLVLLRVEFTLPWSVTSHAVGSYPTLSPLPDLKCVSLLTQWSGGLLSAALVVRLLCPAVSWHSALCSPDFPPYRLMLSCGTAFVWFAMPIIILVLVACVMFYLPVSR